MSYNLISSLQISYEYTTDNGSSVSFRATTTHFVSPLDVARNAVEELAALACRLGISEGVLLDCIRQGYTLAGGGR